MFDLLGRLEERRNEIEVCALEEDFEEMEPDAVVKEMCGGIAREIARLSAASCTSHGTRTHHMEQKNTSHVTRHSSHVTRHTSHVNTSHVTHPPSYITRHVTRHTSHVTHRFSLSLQTVDLAQFFQDKMDTIEWLLAKKGAAAKGLKQHNSALAAAAAVGNQRPFVVDLLQCIELEVLVGFRDDFRGILRRLEVVKSQIQTIKESFEARLASKTSEDQAKLNTAINWMTRLTIVVMPMNLIAGFFGMNVPVPWSGAPALLTHTHKPSAVTCHTLTRPQTPTPSTGPHFWVSCSAPSSSPASSCSCSPPPDGTTGASAWCRRTRTDSSTVTRSAF